MVFSSLLFLFRFLPVMLLIYFAAPARFRNGVLFIGSLVFYGWGEPVYIVLMLFSTLVDFVHGKLVQSSMEKGNKRRAKCLVASSAAINLGLLCFFKYADFLIGAVNSLSGLKLPYFNLPLPIGISFYTFQTMSYTIDVYRGEAKAQSNIVDFGAYVSMFPQLIAGPIVRYGTIAKELNHRRETFDQFALGIRYFVIGLGKKVLIANRVGALWQEIQGVPDAERTVAMVWLGIVAYGLQIYFDFSGYSDMAVGLGQMMGFHFPENFRYPYISKSITEFWRRWHISLGTWFREYVYIPLGGNRKGKMRQICNIMIVWLLTGIWHGAGWNFLWWGVYFGILLLIEKLWLAPWLKRLPGWLQTVYAMVLVCFGWVLFVHEDMGAGLQYLKQMLGFGGLSLWNGRTGYLLISNGVLLATALLGSTPLSAKCWNHWNREKDLTVAEMLLLAAGMLLVTAYLVDASYNPFLYFRF